MVENGGWYISDMRLKIPNEVKCTFYDYCATNNVIWEWMLIYLLILLKSMVSMLVCSHLDSGYLLFPLAWILGNTVHPSLDRKEVTY